MPVSNTPLTSERFLEIVAQSGLVPDKKLSKIEERIRQKLDGQLPSSPKKLARVLEKAELITEWHSEKLLAGKYKGFFIGRYKLLGHIGTGGMSSVYLAEHTRMGDRRAIKVLPKSRVANATYLARFQLEAKAIASLNHPNIVLAYDIDNEGDIHYIVMEYVDGLDFQQLVKRDGPLEFSAAADIIAQAARGLEHAHANGVIHRDIKPANLLVDQKGLVRLLDMGLALVSSNEEESMTVANNENVLGTADYLAPEQALNSHNVDHRADIYGLGCTMYYLLTGQPPFSDGTLAQRIAKHQTEMPKPIRTLRPDCPGEIDGIVVKMIQKDPRYRYQSAADVAAVLEKFVAAVPLSEKVTSGTEAASRAAIAKPTSSVILNSDSDVGGESPTSIGGSPPPTVADARKDLVHGGLSSGDSGRLVAVPRPDPADGGSFLDLQAESGYGPNSNLRGDRPGSSSDPASGSFSSSNSAAASGPRSRSGSKTGTESSASSGASSVHVGAESDIYGRPRSSHSGSSGGSRSGNRRQGLDPPLLFALATALFIVALSIGFFLARITS